MSETRPIGNQTESMEELLRGVAKAFGEESDFAFETLCESGLLRLLEAGHEMANAENASEHSICVEEWDAALAAMRLKHRTADKGERE